jgi:prolyl-tRNA editing enzyme YbaK/EbsC (Cys-tRNA(Pro) deacylase)
VPLWDTGRVRTSVDVHNFLLERDIPHEVFLAKGRLRSADRIAAVLDLHPSEVGRVVVFESSKGALAAVVASDREPVAAWVARAAQVPRVTPASPERAAQLTDYLAAAIPPAGLPKGVRMLLDRQLNRDEVLYFPAGEPRAVLKIRGTDLRRATRAKVARVSPDPVAGRGDAPAAG